MPVINYRQITGEVIEVDLPEGTSVMQGAVDNMFEGLSAECGGACSCATCQVYVDDAWMSIVGEACSVEKEMLAGCDGVRSNSRLSCQILVTQELNGLIVEIPPI